MERPTCEACAFWVKFPVEGATQGNCFRYPPKIVGPDPEDDCQYREYDINQVEYPQTANWLWCGEHPDFPAYLAALKQQTTPHP